MQELEWLTPEAFRGPARRFAEFCLQDICEQADDDGFDQVHYEQAVRLILNKLQYLDDEFDEDQSDEMGTVIEEIES